MRKPNKLQDPPLARPGLEDLQDPAALGPPVPEAAPPRKPLAPPPPKPDEQRSGLWYETPLTAEDPVEAKLPEQVVSGPVSGQKPAPKPPPTEAETIKDLLDGYARANAEAVGRRNDDFLLNYETIAHPDRAEAMRKTNEPYYDQPLTDITGATAAGEARVKMDQGAYNLQRQREEDDPNSEVSRGLQDRLKSMGMGDWSGVSASHLKSIVPYSQIQSREKLSADNIAARIKEKGLDREMRMEIDRADNATKERVAQILAAAGYSQRELANMGLITVAMINQEGKETVAGMKGGLALVQTAPRWMEEAGTPFIVPIDARFPPDKKQLENIEKARPAYEKTDAALSRLSADYEAAASRRPLPLGRTWLDVQQDLAAASEALVKAPNANGVATGRDLEFAGKQIIGTNQALSWLLGSAPKAIARSRQAVHESFASELHGNGMKGATEKDIPPGLERGPGRGGAGGSAGPVNPARRDAINTGVQAATGGRMGGIGEEATRPAPAGTPAQKNGAAAGLQNALRKMRLAK